MSYNNNSSQKERRAILKNDATTLHQFAQSEAGEVGGRFAKPAAVNASQQVVHYPKLSGGPWSDQPGPGPEPPYGEDISSPPIVGEYAEVQASLDRDFNVQRSLRDGAPERVHNPQPDAPGEGECQRRKVSVMRMRLP
jgi:hypothetical protein